MSGRGADVPFTPDLRAVLERQREKTTTLETAEGRIIPWVFHRKGKPIVSFLKMWKKACAEAGSPDRIPHDLRRTAVRNLERAGVPRGDAMKLVGHKTESLHRRYDQRRGIAQGGHGEAGQAPREAPGPTSRVQCGPD